nr:hypothetical protein 15 [bacterium]
MAGRIDAYLILGCGGFETPSGFVVCNSVSNPMLDLSMISEDKYEKTILFLDKACKLFDNPIYDYNKLVNSVSMLYKTYEVIEEERLIEIQRFIRLHKDCGIFLILLLKEDFYARQ